MNNENENPVYTESTGDNKAISMLEQLLTNQENAVETSTGIWFRQARLIQMVDAFLVSKYTSAKPKKQRFFNEMRKVLETFIRKTSIRHNELNVTFPEKAWNYLLKAAHNEFGDDEFMNDFHSDYIMSLGRYGTAVTKIVHRGKGKNIKKVIPFSSFICDQNNAENHPMGESFDTNLEMLRSYEKYDQRKVQKMVNMVVMEMKNTFNATKAPIKLYEIHGMMPADIFEDGATGVTRGMFIIGETGNGKKVVLYTGKTKTNPYQIDVINKIYNRTMGYGPMEAMIEPQIATNELGNLSMELLRSTSKVIYQTSDTELDGQELQDIDNLTLISHEEGSPITQVSTSPQAFSAIHSMMNSVVSMGRESAAIQDASVGRGPKSNVSFAAIQANAKEADGIYSHVKLRILDRYQVLYKKSGGFLDMCIDYFETGKDIEDLLTPTQLYGFKKFVSTKKANLIVNEQIEKGAAYIDPIDEVAEFVLKRDKNKKTTIELDEKIDREYLIDKSRLTLGGESDKIVEKINSLEKTLNIVSANPQVYPNFNPEDILMEILELQNIVDYHALEMSQGPTQSGQIAQTPTGPQVASQAGLTQ